MADSNFDCLELDSVDVAKAIRYVAHNQGLNINMTQINKLLYIAYGTMLVNQKKRLTKEHPSAWPYGPVFPRVHRHIRLSDNITQDAYDALKIKDPSITDLLEKVVKTFGKIPATQLSAWSHQLGSPWDIAVKESNGAWNTPIKDEAIYNYFYSFLNISAQNE